MRQVCAAPADVVAVVQFPGKLLGVVVAVDAGSALARGDGADAAAGAAEVQAVGLGKRDGIVDGFVRDAGNLHAQAHGGEHVAVAEFLRNLGDRFEVFGRKDAAARHDAA